MYHHNGSNWRCMIPNGPNDPKTLLIGILHDYMSCWTTLGPFQRPTGAPRWPKASPRRPKISPKWPFMTPHVPTWHQMALNPFPRVYYMILCHVGPPLGLCRGTLGPRWPLKMPNMAYNHELCPWEMFKGHLGSCGDILGHDGIFWVIKFLHWRAILGHEWPFWVMKGHFGAVLGNFGAPMGLWKGLRVVQHDIISCNISMGSGSGPFGVMYGHLGSWRAILMIFGAILVMLLAI